MHFLILLLTLQAGRCSSPEQNVLLQSAHVPRAQTRRAVQMCESIFLSLSFHYPSSPAAKEGWWAKV